MESPTRRASKRRAPKSKTAGKVPTPDEIFAADDRWLRLMSNRNYFRDFMNVVLKRSKLKQPVCYQGNFFYSVEENITPLIDEETHDIVSLIADRFTPVKGQRIYSNPTSYFLEHRPIPGCHNIYFVGDVHGNSEGGDFEVHWNCFIVYYRGPADGDIIWYDPAYSRETLRSGTYNFDLAKESSIVNSIHRFTGVLRGIRVTPEIQAQRVCNPEFECVDSFCQTWVMMFAASYVEERAYDFLRLPFDKYGNLILKTWLYCLMTKEEGLTEWLTELKTKGLKAFGYCRLPPITFEGLSEEQLLRAVRISKVETLPKDPDHTCMDAVIDRFRV